MVLAGYCQPRFLVFCNQIRFQYQIVFEVMLRPTLIYEFELYMKYEI